jgi:hypothetical protein
VAVTPLRRLVVMPGVIERPDEEPPTPDEAVRRLLATHAQAPHLLSEARHRGVVMRDSVAAAAQAARCGRDAEVAHEVASRASDPRGRRSVHFGPAVVAVGALLAVCGAAAFMLARGLPWPDRAVLSFAAAVLGGAAAWWESRARRNPAARPGHGRGGGLAAAAVLAWAAALAALCVLTTTGALAIRAAQSAALGVVLVAAVAAARSVLEHAEGWHCSTLRRESSRAARRRRDAAAQASDDEAAAQAALGAWESLVVEECQIGHPGASGGAAGGTWLDDCLSVARKAATPA